MKSQFLYVGALFIDIWRPKPSIQQAHKSWQNYEQNMNLSEAKKKQTRNKANEQINSKQSWEVP